MNSFNNSFEKNIKKQIDERELTPSRDLWAEIQAQTDNSGFKKSKFNWVYLAACFVVIFGLGAVLFLNNDDDPKIQMAEAVKTPSLESETVAQPEIINSQEIITDQDQEKLTQVKNQPLQENAAQEIQTQSNLPLIKENPSEVASQIIQNSPAKIIAKSDSVQVKKKKRYVDPSTLLFSIEHKEVIEKSKDGSNVATIDLNNK
ncbi:hypothetical protein [Chryseobacterium caseinilyticum]|uniref:Uncharacterized protein n=1 Tax=Chryseobacterium caseinilyticum TaxID=2771428 RepID=A0ABR8ZDD7_9FLAO|nr:hypothetical protein [Chryseobacterium caseinilyticum]MBD8083247.1 hypothetical protein [Chryseobacterium caseinilyticum]